MPHEHSASGCVIVADSYLTDRDILASELGVENGLPDCSLIFSAYLKWGSDCARHLSGDFAFAIWDPREQRLFACTDPFGRRPFFYAYEAGKHFIFANTMAPFRILCPDLTINDDSMIQFALDSKPAEGTCYREVYKIAAGHHIRVTSHSLQKQKYWSLKDQKRSLPYKRREDYYEAFRELFASAVKTRMNTDHKVMAHISGGLDSSAVASMAAQLASEKDQTLHGFTAIPRTLEGPSFRNGWLYHEMPVVQSVLAQYPNIEHFVFHTDPVADPYQELRPFLAFTDQPYRNISNYHWILASLQRLTTLGGRILLTGGRGNASISWAGQSWRDKASALYRGAKIWKNPEQLFEGYYAHHNQKFLRTVAAKRILRRRGIILDKHYFMLSQRFSSSINGSSRPLSLWYGVEQLDPTMDLKLVEFCYNLPQWVYFRGRETLEKRLLVREALAGIVPEPVRHNPNRGEQAADWYLQYNNHRLKWREGLKQIAPGAASRLWQWYDRKAMFDLFDVYESIERPGRDVNLHVGLGLMRCLSLGFYLDYLERNTP